MFSADRGARRLPGGGGVRAALPDQAALRHPRPVQPRRVGAHQAALPLPAQWRGPAGEAPHTRGRGLVQCLTVLKLPNF